MFGEDVDFDIYAIARSVAAQGRHRQCVGNEHDRKGIGPDVDERQADAIDGDRAFGNEERGPGGIDLEGEEFPFPVVTAFAERGGGVDVALDEMSSETGPDLERPLEINVIADLADSQVCSVERFWPGLDLESLAVSRHDREAATADSHAFTKLERFAGVNARPCDCESRAGIFHDNPLEPPQSFNQPRKHVCAPFVAPPIVRFVTPG